MKWLLIIIVPILVYVGLGWIVADIYFSMVDTADMSIRDYNETRIWIYNIISVVYMKIIGSYIPIRKRDSDVDDWLSGLSYIPLGLAFIMQLIPISNGAAWLNLLLCTIEMMIYTFLTVADD